MSFIKKPERPAKNPTFRGAPVSSGLLLRMLLVGLLAIFGAAWALVRHYTQTLPPLRVPVTPREAPTFDVDAGELHVPEVVAPDGEAR
jgi:hypothetical protein